MNSCPNNPTNLLLLLSLLLLLLLLLLLSLLLLWDQTQIFFSGNITIPNVTTQSVIFGFTDTKHFLLINYLLLI